MACTRCVYLNSPPVPRQRHSDNCAFYSRFIEAFIVPPPSCVHFRSGIAKKFLPFQIASRAERDAIYHRMDLGLCTFYSRNFRSLVNGKHGKSMIEMTLRVSLHRRICKAISRQYLLLISNSNLRALDLYIPFILENRKRTKL